MSAEHDPPLEILQTRYDELINNERALFDRILGFYGIPADDIEMRPPKKTIEDCHYRCGRADEWNDVFTAEQKARALAIVGRDLLDHFGWRVD